MEKYQDSFSISPTNISLQPNQQIIKFNVKNTSNRSSRYEIFINDIDHFKIITSRTFTLAPGITKNIKIQHNQSPNCTSFPQIIQVIDANGTRKFVHFRCCNQQNQDKRKVILDNLINLEKIKTNQQKILEIEFRNISSQNLKLKVRYAMAKQLDEKIQFKVLDSQMVVLKDASKKVRVSIKLLRQVDFQIQVLLEFTEQNSREKWQQIVKITGNSLIRSQFIADENMNKIECINHQILNGTTVTGNILLVNNYHKSCPFKLLQIVQVVDYKSYCQRLQEITLKLDLKEGFIQEKGYKKINYTLSTSPNQNDKSFTLRYNQLAIKDQANSYKLRNSNFFKKNLQVLVKVQFGQDNPSTFKLKAHIVNPAIKTSRTSNTNGEIFQILNDSSIDVPFKISGNLYYAAKVPKGKLKQGLNQLQIQWRKQGNEKCKQNINGFLKCAIKLQIPQNEIILFQPSTLQRPKTALIRSGSMSKQNLRQRISLKAPSKVGSFGIKNLKEINNQSFLLEPSRYIKGELFDEEQLKYLQVNQNQKGNVITNSHKNKNIVLYFPDKGYLHLESQHSYLVPYQKKSLKFQFSGRLFEINSKDVEDKQPFKIINKQLTFCFNSTQKQFEVIREIQIANRSNQAIMMYCLSVDDDYFHSLQQDNKMLIPPKSTGAFRISFYPQAQIRLKTNKIIRTLQFLINNQKEQIICEGDMLTADIQIDEKKLAFNNCRYSAQEIVKKITFTNKGLNKVSYHIIHSENIKMTPKTNIINEKNKQIVTLSFVPAKLPKEYSQNIVVNFKGSHAFNIPLYINTLQPSIQFKEQTINFKEGYLNQTLTAYISITNHNPYSCSFNINSNQTQLKTQKSFMIGAGETKSVDFQLLIKEVGEKIIKLPPNLIELCGYGALKGPTQYRYIGKKTLLQLIPDNPFTNLIFTQLQQTKSFKIKNLSQNIQTIDLALTPLQNYNEAIILSCEPNAATLYPSQQKQFKLLSIRGDHQFNKSQSKFFNYNISLNLKQNKKYRRFDFTVEVPPPQLQISPKQVYFPLATIGCWSKSSFKIYNQGYKEVLVAIKKPINVAFEIEVRMESQTSRLTKLNNSMEVSVLYKSKKPISFTVVLDIQDNFAKKYQVKLFGTTSNSPLLNCQRTVSSSARGFSSKQIRTSNTPSVVSSSNLMHCSQDIDNIRFINRWLSSVLIDFSKQNQNYNTWLKIPRHFIQFLKYLNIQITYKEDSIDYIIEQLKKHGFPLYTVKITSLMQGKLDQWSMCLWFILSKQLIHQDTLKWINKICGFNIQTYENAFNHQKKIFNQLLSKLFDPIFKGKVTELQKILEYLQPSLPVLSKIQNKKQFIIAINILYYKFAKVQRKKILINNLQHVLSLSNKHKGKKCHWVLGSNNFQTVIGENCFNPKYISQKKMVSFWTQGDDNVTLKLKDDINIAVWNNSLFEPLQLYELQINKKAPNIHNICIQCQNKCSQEWKLLFPCDVESEYFFQFSGGMEFKCKMPDLGIIKEGDIMEFRIVYSPTNLKEHSGVLKISNKYQQHIYNLKGKSLRSNYVEIERCMRIPQGQKYQQAFSVIEDPQVCTQQSNYKILVIGQPCDQIIEMEAKSNKKEIIVQLVLQFNKVVQDQQVFLQVFNEEMTFCKNIRLIISVIPKPVIIQAKLKGIIDKTTIQKIPITNCLPKKQNCNITLCKITKQQYQNFNRFHLQKQQQKQCSECQFKLSQTGKIVLKPKQKININISYLPIALTQSYCQIRIKMQSIQNVIVYNFLGSPQLPFTDNPPLIIKCQAEQQTIETIRVPNKLRDKITFEVQTNLPFIAGAQQITLNNRQIASYPFKLLPLHAGQFQGEILFKNQKICLVYPLKISVVSTKKIRKIRVQSKIRITSIIQIELSNKSDRDISYQVLCKSQYLKTDPLFLLPANSEKSLTLTYTPLFVGTKNTQLKLFHETMPQINYNLQMISEDYRESFKYNCALGEKKKIKIPIRNPTSQSAQLFEPKLPKQLSYFLPNNEHFPVSIPAYGVYSLQMFFNQYNLADSYKYTLQLLTRQIGTFNFDLLFVNQTTKRMPQTIIHYQSDKKEIIKKEAHIELLNHFDQALQFTIPNQTIQINKYTMLHIDNPLKFHLKGYQKKKIKCQITIFDTQIQKEQSSAQKIEASQNKSASKQIIIECRQFKWIFPIQVVKVLQAKNVLQIIGSSQQLAKTRISLKMIKGIKSWVISDLANYKEHVNLSFISSRQVYLETIFNKPFEYNGSVLFYDDDMVFAEKYSLSIKIGEKKYQKIWIVANVGEKAKVQIRLKNGKGNFKVQIKNNKMKEFGVFPMQGQFTQKGQNIIVFEYAPVQYNGNKKAQILITSQYGSFNFYLMGKFPPLK